jgi:hypothetical protein
MEDDDGRIQEGMMTMTGNNFIGVGSVYRICGAVHDYASYTWATSLTTRRNLRVPTSHYNIATESTGLF